MNYEKDKMSIAMLLRYKELMKEARAIEADLLCNGWKIMEQDNGEYGMLNLNAMKELLDKPKEN